MNLGTQEMKKKVQEDSSVFYIKCEKTLLWIYMYVYVPNKQENGFGNARNGKKGFKRIAPSFIWKCEKPLMNLYVCICSQ